MNINLKKGLALNNSEGFTLIELLVVIAIIGILSSIVLASLNTARNRAKIAAGKAELSSMRAEAEIYYDSVGSYANTSIDPVSVCDAATGATTYPVPYNLYNSARLSVGDSATSCFPTAGAWAASIDLGGSKHFCVDSTGAAREIGSATTSETCPTS